MCSFNWKYRCRCYMRSIPPKIPKIHKSAGGRLEFVLANQDSRDPDRAIIFTNSIAREDEFGPTVQR